MHTTTLRKVGGSVMLAVPKALLDILDLRAGATVGVDVDSGRLVVEPLRRPRYTLDDLLSKCEPEAPSFDEERAWVSECPVGDELI
jgi:antitoxin ChpS